MAETIDRETPDYIVWREEREGAVTVRFEVKAGSVLLNEPALEAKAVQALGINQAYLALASPTNAQNVAQIRALTRQTNALIRLLLNLVDDTAGT